MIERSLQKVYFFIEQHRFAEADKELRQLMASQPGEPYVLYLAAVCKLQLKEFDKAEEFVKSAIGIDPANPDFLCLYARILFVLRKSKEAEGAINQAIQLNPYNASYFSILSDIYFERKEWEKALHFANEGLAIDPEDVSCLNNRAAALMKLDRKESAYDTIKEALNQDPENEYTHTNLGWGLLERGQPKEALKHFQQALKINPDYEWAKAGLVEALKAKYLFYRLFLGYTFWLNRFQSNVQWAIIIGLYIGSRVISYLSETYPALSPFLTPISILYIVFAFSTWIARPLSNLFLRLNVYGRYALQPKEIRSSNYVGTAFFLCVLSFLGFLLLHANIFVIACVYFLTLMVPLSSMLNPEKKQNRTILVVYTLSLIVIGLLYMISLFTVPQQTLATIYLFGVFAYGFVANALVMRE